MGGNYGEEINRWLMSTRQASSTQSHVTGVLYFTLRPIKRKRNTSLMNDKIIGTRNKSEIIRPSLTRTPREEKGQGKNRKSR